MNYQATPDYIISNISSYIADCLQLRLHKKENLNT
jgi:hypothetical protein